MDLIENDKIDMKKLNSFKKEQLNKALLAIGFNKGQIKRFNAYKNPNFSIKIYRFPSNLARCDAIMTLYRSIESGYSQCHSTGNRKKASGGWYCTWIENL